MNCFKRIFIVISCVFFVNFAHAQSGSNQTGKIDKEIKQLAKQKEKKQKEKAKYEKLLKAKNKEITKAKNKLSELDKAVKQKNQEASEIRQQIAADKNNIAQTKEQKKALLVSAYKLSKLDYFELLFSQEDPNQTRRMIDYFAYFTQQRDETVRLLNLSLKGLNEKQQSLESKLADLSQSKLNYKNEKQQLEKKNKERKRLITKLGKDISVADKKIARLKEDRARVTKLIAKLKKQAAAKRRSYVPRSGGFVKQKGLMPYPVPGKFVRSYGAKIGNSRMTTNGVNIKTKPSTNVQAIYDGEVIFANVLKGFGNLIIIDHGNNYMSLYGNNDVLRRREGEEIAAGDVIAQTGSNTEQGNFYFEIRHKGKPINPKSWCR